MRRLIVGAVTLLILMFAPHSSFAADDATKPAPTQPIGTQASCYAAGCTGLDPDAAGCSAGAFTLESFSDYGVYYEMRYSNECYATWTRMTAPGSGCNMAWGQIMTYSERLIYGAQVCGGTGWTRMISFEYSVKTCVSYVWATGAPNKCTQLR